METEKKLEKLLTDPSIKDRLRDFMHFKKIKSETELARIINAPQATVHKYLTNGKPSLDFILRLCFFFKEINLDWLILGKGSMIRPEGKDGHQYLSSDMVVKETESHYQIKYEGEKDKNNMLTKQIESLQKTIDIIHKAQQ